MWFFWWVPLSWAPGLVEGEGLGELRERVGGGAGEPSSAAAQTRHGNILMVGRFSHWLDFSQLL